MSDFTPRVLGADELRAANQLFRAALHLPPSGDEEWERTGSRVYQPGRTLGVFGAGDERPVGTARSMDAELTVPGGRRLPCAAVTGVGVRQDRTRRGVLSELIRTQFEDFTARGVPFAGLYATEGRIYGRYGYGVTTVARSYTVDTKRAALRQEVPRGGEIELLDVDAAIERLPGIYASLPAHGAGHLTRGDAWWAGCEAGFRRSEKPIVTVVHHGESGPDGFASYYADRAFDSESVLHLEMLHAGNDAARGGLWRYLTGVDLIDQIDAPYRGAGDPLPLLFEDPRSAKVSAAPDELWLRLVDVPAALAARAYGPGSLVLEVTDAVLPANAGRYLIDGGEVTRTDRPAQLRVGVAELAMLYLGTWTATALAAAGRAEALDATGPALADDLFGTRTAAWCGTFF
ncbi:GNAT family N-acetyltransferase [Amycolatopsis sp. 195334CR]|uniref:GNAT family N-acetyltransferase n=1 Tax=Amycolatopsis sp. 195334CR TaxID=2814588 RepID=UPI001A8FDE40|nr:GNAT family N-acetyltransferase [Amycolatopsis sp. 195334CR]MBN6039441.1 GNAT family N-acetyltransferase [Amycolatopsis sp. 195334CR]